MLERSHPTAAGLMSGHHQSLLRGTAVAEAARMLVSSGLPMVVVRDADGRLAGVLTEHAILAAVADNATAPGRVVDELMNDDPAFVADYASVEWILVEMVDAGTWSLPVTDSQHRLIGVVSLTDLAAVVFPALLADTWNQIVRSRSL